MTVEERKMPIEGVVLVGSLLTDVTKLWKRLPEVNLSIAELIRRVYLTSIPHVTMAIEIDMRDALNSRSSKQLDMSSTRFRYRDRRKSRQTEDDVVFLRARGGVDKTTPVLPVIYTFTQLSRDTDYGKKGEYFFVPHLKFDYPRVYHGGADYEWQILSKLLLEFLGIAPIRVYVRDEAIVNAPDVTLLKGFHGIYNGRMKRFDVIAELEAALADLRRKRAYKVVASFRPFK